MMDSGRRNVNVAQCDKTPRTVACDFVERNVNQTGFIA